MQRFVVATLGVGFLAFMTPVLAGAADPCPAELTQAPTAFKSARASLKKSPEPRHPGSAKSGHPPPVVSRKSKRREPRTFRRPG